LESESVVKKVRITLEVDDHFVRLLQANCQLQGLLGEDPKRMDPMRALAVVALGEMRGATEAQIREKTPIEWRPHLETIHSERRVQVIPEMASSG